MKYALNTLLCLLALALGGIFVWLLERYSALPVVTLDQWDIVATIFWSLVPFMLVLFLGVLTRAVVSLGPALVTLLEGRASLVAATHAELESRSAMNEALMWQARHSAKATRKGIGQ